MSSSYRVKLRWRDLQTGETGVYVERPCGFGSVIRDEEGGWVLFNWKDGNYGCDCNRGGFFRDDVADCGTVRYQILEGWVTPEDSPVGQEEWTPVPELAEPDPVPIGASAGT